MVEEFEINETQNTSTKSGKKKTVGDIVKNTRANRNITIEAASQALMIKEQYLKAIENDDFDALPQSPYNVGHVRSYATFLKLNQEFIVNLFKAELEEWEAQSGIVREKKPLIKALKEEKLEEISSESSLKTSKKQTRRHNILVMLILRYKRKFKNKTFKYSFFTIVILAIIFIFSASIDKKDKNAQNINVVEANTTANPTNANTIIATTTGTTTGAVENTNNQATDATQTAAAAKQPTSNTEQPEATQFDENGLPIAVSDPDGKKAAAEIARRTITIKALGAGWVKLKEDGKYTFDKTTKTDIGGGVSLDEMMMSKGDSIDLTTFEKGKIYYLTLGNVQSLRFSIGGKTILPRTKQSALFNIKIDGSQDIKTQLANELNK